MYQYQELKTLSLSQFGSVAASSQSESVDLDSPARLVVDFLSQQSLTLRPDVGIDAALAAMREVQLRAALVTEREAGDLLGIVTLADLESRKVLSLATSSGLAREDLSIGDLMTPKAELKGVPLSAIETSRVGDLLQTLKHEGQSQMLVVEPDSQRICGLISASDIARRLQMPVAITRRATSFRALVDVISAGRDLA